MAFGVASNSSRQALPQAALTLAAQRCRHPRLSFEKSSVPHIAAHMGLVHAQAQQWSCEPNAASAGSRPKVRIAAVK